MDSGIWGEIRDKLGFARASKPMLVGMAAILVLVAAASWHVLSGAAAASPFEVSRASSDAAEVGGTSEIEEKTLFVHVSGSVEKPGLYELPQGSRVADAIQAAGGFAEGADEDSCNLARVVEDGEHILIARQGDGVSVQEVSAQGQTSAQGIVNINTATEAQLESLPGIGAATAQKIVADRAANGQFKTVDDLTRVSGIGEKKLAALEGLICV